MKTETFRIDHPLARGSEVTSQDLWDFPDGLIGLPEHHRFALVDLPDVPPFRLLASVDDPGFGIVVVDPRLLVPDYVVSIGARQLSPLVERDPEQLRVLVPVVLPTASTPMRLNLKGPILLSPSERRGVQRVSPDDAHPMRYVPDLGGASACSY
ncbi:MAG: flagellar assembly protein FliW [bacterium]